MTYPELQIQLDLNPDNRIDLLRNADPCRLTKYGYLFVDNEDGQCYLFDMNGNSDDIHKVKRIENQAFFNCKSLTSIKIPDSVESIGGYAFWTCTFLTSITIPDSVESIGHGAFYNCEHLTSIEIPNSVKKIEYGAFWNCKSLKKIRIPNSVKWIGEWVFEKCTSLKEVVFKGKTIDQVKAMICYPWEIKDESIIKCLD